MNRIGCLLSVKNDSKKRDQRLKKENADLYTFEKSTDLIRQILTLLNVKRPGRRGAPPLAPPLYTFEKSTDSI